MYGTLRGFGSGVHIRYLVSAWFCLQDWSFLINEYLRFVHERGFRTAIFNLGVLGGINLAVPIGELIVGFDFWFFH